MLRLSKRSTETLITQLKPSKLSAAHLLLRSRTTEYKQFYWRLRSHQISKKDYKEQLRFLISRPFSAFVSILQYIFILLKKAAKITYIPLWIWKQLKLLSIFQHIKDGLYTAYFSIHNMSVLRFFRTAWLPACMTLYGLYFYKYRQEVFVDYHNKTYLLEIYAHKLYFYLKQQAVDQLVNKVLKSEDIPKQVGPQLLHLVQIEKIRKLMTDLFIVMLHNKAFIDDTYQLTLNILLEYLRSDHCLDRSKYLIVEFVLKNEESVLPNLFGLLMNYVMIEDKDHLLDLSADVLKAVLSIDGVQNAATNGIQSELVNQFESPKIYDAAYSAAIEKLQVPQ